MTSFAAVVTFTSEAAGDFLLGTFEGLMSRLTAVIAGSIASATSAASFDSLIWAFSGLLLSAADTALEKG
jgi:phage terminase large subunit-like protein